MWKFCRYKWSSTCVVSSFAFLLVVSSQKYSFRQALWCIVTKHWLTLKIDTILAFAVSYSPCARLSDWFSWQLSALSAQDCSQTLYHSFCFALFPLFVFTLISYFCSSVMLYRTNFSLASTTNLKKPSFLSPSYLPYFAVKSVQSLSPKLVICALLNRCCSIIWIDRQLRSICQI